MRTSRRPCETMSDTATAVRSTAEAFTLMLAARSVYVRSASALLCARQPLAGGASCRSTSHASVGAPLCGRSTACLHNSAPADPVKTPPPPALYTASLGQCGAGPAPTPAPQGAQQVRRSWGQQDDARRPARASPLTYPDAACREGELLAWSLPSSCRPAGEGAPPPPPRCRRSTATPYT